MCLPFSIRTSPLTIVAMMPAAGSLMRQPPAGKSWTDPAERLIAIQMIQVPLAQGGAYRRAFRELTYAALTGSQ